MSDLPEAQTLIVTGVTGQVAESVATSLAAAGHHVTGVARFSDAAARERLEAAGVACASADLVEADFGAVPTGVDALLNFAVVKTQRWDLDLRANAEGIGLLIAHVRPARVLHCSSTGVYDPAGATVLDESAALGDNHRPIMPTYSIAKIAAEEVVRTMCRLLDVPTTIARLNVPYGVGPDGTPRGWPAFHLAMMQAGLPIPVHPDRPNLFNPIDLADIAATVPALLGAATVPATIVNWGGAEQVSLEEWCEHLADRCGYRATFEETESTIGGVTVDLERMVSITGPTTVAWKDGFDALADAWLASQA
ncbi:NAD-dependent epimerase/dehydratase family protein [Dermatobacter hominis]|uniref:NAD-dependent epimerase/dehydratase family protein n=1 Tax=Dermatobacter hominis TaxID=2884263 RepID=UPI001D102A6E|nr:NAD(P)-dependent oxidoreductase [Dermatobacter hominis]UDY36369.1 NAD(P)-dependent oxidoreductase [Dermatobacter hominis]